MKQFLLPTVIFLALAGLTACSKSDTNGPATSSNSPRNLSVYLTDAPASFDAVFLDIQKVEAKVDTSIHRDDDHFGDSDKNEDDDHLGAKGDGDHQGQDSDHDSYGYWVLLNSQPGLVNVYNLRNGLDSMLAHGIVNGTVRKIRMTLGANSYVVKNGVQYPLTLVNGEHSQGKYLYVKLHDEDRDESNGKVGVWIDFDIARSIFYNDGKYYLRPYLKPFCDKNFAEVEGKVTPWEANPVVKMFNATDTASAFPNREGEFKIRGLREGTYTLVYEASNSYKSVTVNNVAVSRNKELKLAPVVLTK
jgi:hypothetical protein